MGMRRLPRTNHPNSDQFPVHHSDDGLFGFVIGGCSVTPQSVRRLESFSVRAAHKLEGTQNSQHFLLILRGKCRVSLRLADNTVACLACLRKQGSLRYSNLWDLSK